MAIREIFNAIFSADKVLRCTTVFVICTVVATILRHYDAAIFIALIAGIGAGIGAEYLASRKGGTFDTWRILATFVGASVAALCCILLLIV